MATFTIDSSLILDRALISSTLKTSAAFSLLSRSALAQSLKADAKPSCKKYHQKITLPNKGDKVSVTGIHMLDKQHGWLEIHPVTANQDSLIKTFT